MSTNRFCRWVDTAISFLCFQYANYLQKEVVDITWKHLNDKKKFSMKSSNTELLPGTPDQHDQ